MVDVVASKGEASLDVAMYIVELFPWNHAGFLERLMVWYCSIDNL